MEALRRERGMAPTHSRPRHWMWVSCQRHAPTALSPGERTIGAHWTWGWHGQTRACNRIIYVLVYFRMEQRWRYDCDCVKVIKIAVLWDVATCSLVNVDRRFSWANCLHHQDDEWWCYIRKTTTFILDVWTSDLIKLIPTNMCEEKWASWLS
jgi:hypothetical protein